MIGYNPTIVTDGLVLYLDAANGRSYPGSGTTWSDLSGNGNHGTLVNGVGYNSGALGSLSFDGVNDYVSTTFLPNLNNNRLYTYEVWFKDSATGVLNGSNTNLITNYGFTGTAPFSAVHVNAAGNILFNERNTSGTITNLTSISSVVDDTWKHIVGVAHSSKLSIFINGELDNEYSSRPGGTITSNQNYLIGSGHLSRYQSCNISIVKMYLDKALSQEEIQQNFNATRGRFGL